LRKLRRNDGACWSRSNKAKKTIERSREIIARIDKVLAIDDKK